MSNRLAFWLAPLLPLLATACSEAPEQALASRWPMLKQYCTDCHNDAELSGGMSLEHVTTADVAANPKRWEEVVRRLRGSLMPPPGNPHPKIDQAKQFVAALEANLDAAAATRGAAPGRTLLHRLNRVEYATAVEDLLGVSVDPAKLLPPDATSDGFDNVAEVLRVTPTYLDQYIAAARDVSLKAVGNPKPTPARAEYVAKNQNHTTHVEGLPLGTRDGLVVEHYFPADGEYVLRLNVTSVPGGELRYYPQGWLAYEHTGILTIDGQRVFEAKLGGPNDLRDLDRYQIVTVNAIKDRFRDIHVNVKAGYRKVGATFVARSHAESDYALQRFTPGEGVPDVPWMLGVEVVGPYEPTGISVETRSRDRIFTCHPKDSAEELPCAERILSRLA